MAHYQVRSFEFAAAIMRELGKHDPSLTTSCTAKDCRYCKQAHHEWVNDTMALADAIRKIVNTNSMEF